VARTRPGPLGGTENTVVDARAKVPKAQLEVVTGAAIVKRCFRKRAPWNLVRREVGQRIGVTVVLRVVPLEGCQDRGGALVASLGARALPWGRAAQERGERSQGERRMRVPFVHEACRRLTDRA